MYVHKFAAGAIALAFAFLAFPAVAAEPGSQGWTITLKANGGVSPAWEGSNDLSPYLLPGLSVRRAGSAVTFSAPDDSPGFALFDENWMKAGVVGKLRGPRRSADYAALRGVHDVDWTVEAGLFAEFWPFEKLRARIEARHGFTGHHGNVVDLSMDWVERRGPWTVSVGPRLSLGDTRYMDKLFGVSAYDAVMSGLPPYRAEGGAKSFGVAAAVSYEWSRNWTTTAYARYNRLVGSAAESPLVAGPGSRNQFTLGAIVAYSFDWAGF
ncbi:MAG: MipA/OmpV family protein [Rhodoblastus sp.]|jgi:outer membrane scaffolding protein for murein synthesis (MipA/OmpV family)